MAKSFAIFNAMLVAFLLAGCLGSDQGDSPANQGAVTQPADTNVVLGPVFVKDKAKALGHAAAKVENVTIQAENGVSVAMTVYYPQVDAQEPTPLLLHSHGFGGNRVTTLDFDEATQTSEVGIDTLQLAFNEKSRVAKRKGWYVISYDQAGHGDSTGNVNIMDPTYEGKMLKAVLDWAEGNLSNLAYRNKNAKANPVIGTIGRSYGGAFQLMAAGIDDRIDAMVPNGTWFDLRYSLNPGGVPKTTYLNALVLSGLQSIQGRFETFLYEELIRANITNEVTPATVQRLGSNGSVSYCTKENFGSFRREMRLKSDIPALFIQGAHDIIFNLTEAIQNFECYFAVNKQSRLLMVQFGHSLDALGLQASPAEALAGTGAKYSFNESKVWLRSSSSACPSSLFDAATGRCVLDLKNIMFQFLVQHLEGVQFAGDSEYLGFAPVDLPLITAVLEDGRGDSTAIGLNDISSSKRGSWSEPTTPTEMFEQLTGLTGIPSGLADTQLAPLARPVFKPLSNGNVAGCYVGVPGAKVTISPGALPAESPEQPIVYVGLGVKRKDGRQFLLHEQATPVKGYGNFELLMPGIALQLNDGDALLFAVQGFNPAFSSSFNKVPAPVSVAAQVALPVPIPGGVGQCVLNAAP